MSQQVYDVLIVGEGISGLTAARTLAQKGLTVATLEAQLFGGLIINVNELEPGPGERQTSGAEYAAELMQANAELGVTSIQEAATAIKSDGSLKRVVAAGASYEARHVVIASGARLKKLGVPGETEFEGRGVSQCADCDGPMYQNEEVVVVGGGDSALQEALVLARFCGKVHLVHRGHQFRARAQFVEQVKANAKISIIWNAGIDRIIGSRMVEKICVKLGGGGNVKEIPCAGIFAYVGLAPNSEFLPQEIERDGAGFVSTSETLETAMAGVYAVGAVRRGYGGLLTDAISEARLAADGLCERLT